MEEEAIVWDKLPGDTSELELHKLSHVPMMHILKNVPLGDIVEMCFVNNEMRSAVRTSGRRIDEFKIRVENEKPRIEIRSQTEWFRWNLYLPARDSTDAKERLTTQQWDATFRRKISYFTLDCVRNEHGIFASNHDLENVLPKVFVYFVGIFDCSRAFISDFHIDVNTVEDIRSLLEHFRYYTIKSMSMVQEMARPVYTLYGLDELRIENLHLDIELTRTRTHEREVPKVRDTIQSIHHLNVSSCSWMDSSEILNFNGKTMVLGTPNTVQMEGLTNFVKRWIGGEHAELMWLNVKMEKQWRLKEIVKGIETQPYEFKYQQCNCPHRVISGLRRTFFFLPDSVQVTRADGTKATVCTSRSQFFFHVSDDGTPVFGDVAHVDELDTADLRTQLERMKEVHRQRVGSSNRLGEHIDDIAAETDALTVFRQAKLLDRREEAFEHPETEGRKIRADIRSIDRKIDTWTRREAELRREMVEKIATTLEDQPLNDEFRLRYLRNVRSLCLRAVGAVEDLIGVRQRADVRIKGLYAILHDAGIPTMSAEDEADDVGADDVGPEEDDTDSLARRRAALIAEMDTQNAAVLLSMTEPDVLTAELNRLRQEFEGAVGQRMFVTVQLGMPNRRLNDIWRKFGELATTVERERQQREQTARIDTRSAVRVQRLNEERVEENVAAVRNMRRAIENRRNMQRALERRMVRIDEEIQRADGAHRDRLLDRRLHQANNVENGRRILEEVNHELELELMAQRAIVAGGAGAPAQPVPPPPPPPPPPAAAENPAIPPNPENPEPEGDDVEDENDDDEAEDEEEQVIEEIVRQNAFMRRW